MTFFLSRHFSVYLILGLVLCLLGACAGAGGMGGNTPKVESNPSLTMVQVPAGSAVWVEVTDKSDLGDVGQDVRSLLVALLQSDKGLSVADSAAAAAGTVRINILQMGLTNSEQVNFDMSQGFGVGLTGAVLGLGIGSGVGGRKGALWGAGLGLALGFTAGGAGGGGSEDTWALLADVQMLSARAPKGRPAKEAKGTEVLSRVAVSAQGRDMLRESALATLEDALVQHIIGHIEVR